MIIDNLDLVDVRPLASKRLPSQEQRRYANAQRPEGIGHRRRGTAL
ncbi:hypothetical protein [Mastigocladopsis repens]|nr:hypothetical protein [Mastigocladopsis repens]